MVKLAVLLSRVRQDEKLIFDALTRRGVEFEKVDDRELVFDLTDPAATTSGLTASTSKVVGRFDSVLLRSVSQTRAQTAAAILAAAGTKPGNSPATLATCNDKILTTIALVQAGLPSPRTLVSFDPESALKAVEDIGYPAVLKPPTGSWGRLLSRVNDRDAAEAVVEHKDTLGSYVHSIYYVQEHVAKPGRDIRIIVIGGRAVAGMYRYSEHWVTNAARGGHGVNCPVDGDIGRLAEKAAAAVGGGAVAVDIFESPRGLLVNEVNATMEFKECTAASGADIAGALVDYWLEVARP